MYGPKSHLTLQTLQTMENNEVLLSAPAASFVESSRCSAVQTWRLWCSFSVPGPLQNLCELSDTCQNQNVWFIGDISIVNGILTHL